MNRVPMLDPWTCWRITLALGHVVWIGLVLGGLAALGNRIARKMSADRRYVLNFGTLLLLGLSLPATFEVVRGTTPRPAIALPEALPPAPAAQAAMAFPVVDLPKPEGGPVRDGEMAVGPPRIPELRRADRPAAGRRRSVDFWRPVRMLAPYVTVIYGLGVVAMLGKLLLALCGGLRLRASCRPIVDGPVAEIVARQSGLLVLRVAPALAYCERVAVPVVLGLARPMILIPAALATGLTTDQLSAVITHELAHIRRHDHWLILVQRALEAMLFFHPAAWFLSRRIDVERENCCDDLVVAALGDRMVYASSLLRAAELGLAFANRPAAAPALDGRRPSELRRRIARVLDLSDEPAVRLTRSGVLAVALLAVLAGGTGAALLSSDEDAKPSRVPPPALEVKAADAQASVSVTGRVLDASGKPLAHVSVGIADLRNVEFLSMEHVLRRTITDADGRFAMPAVPPGEYQVSPLPDLEIVGGQIRAETLPEAYRKYATENGSHHVDQPLPAVFRRRIVTLKAGARGVAVELKAVPHATFTARFVDGRGRPAPAGRGYEVSGRLERDPWSGTFRAVPGRSDAITTLVPLGLREVDVDCLGDNVWWTWAPGMRRANFTNVRMRQVDGDRTEIVAQRLKTASLEIHLRSKSGKLPEDPNVGVYYPRYGGADGLPVPDRVAPGVYRLNHALLPGSEIEVHVRAPGFKSLMTRPFQFTEEGQQGFLEIVLEPGQSTDGIAVKDAVPAVLLTPEGDPIVPPKVAKGLDRAIACRAIDESTGRPVAGALVSFGVEQSKSDEGEDEYMTLEQHETKTDQDGRFTVLVPERYLPDPAPKRTMLVRVTILDPRYVTYFDTVDPREIARRGISDGFPEFRAIKLVPARPVSGRLLGADGQPFPNVTIFKQYLDVKTWPRDGEIPKSGADGRFQMKVPVGMPLKLEFRALKSARKYHAVAADATDLGDIRLVPGVRLKGRVFDDAGQPVPFISVTTPPTQVESQPNFVETTDKDGYFQTDELPPGRYTANVGDFFDRDEQIGAATKPAPALYLPVPFEIREGQVPPELAVRPVPHVSFVGALSAPDREPGQPPDGLNSVATLQVMGTFRDARWTSHLSFLDISDDLKRCTVRVPKGLTDATLEFGDVVQRFQLDPKSPELFGPALRLGRVDNDRLAIQIRRYRPTTIRIKVQRPDGKRPDGLKVEARYVRERDMEAAGVVFKTLLLKPEGTGGDRRFSVLPSEEVALTATAPGGLSAAARVTVTEGETRDVTLKLAGSK